MATAMAEEIDPRTVYWLLATCPICGRRVRASQTLRHWAERPVPDEAEAEMMLTLSEGRGRLRNERAGLWAQLDAVRDHRDGGVLRTKVADYYRLLERRLRAAARAAQDAALRARYGP
jgi:hypothetical protein